MLVIDPLGANPQRSPKSRPKFSTALMQAKELQRLLMEAARGSEITDASLAQVARAWSELEERKRVIRNIPAPRPADVPMPSRRPSSRSVGRATIARIARLNAPETPPPDPSASA